MYEFYPVSKFEKLAKEASKVASVMRRAARLAEKLPNGQFKCEMETIIQKLEDVLDKSTKLGRLVEKEEERLEKEAAAELHAKDRAAKRKG